MPYRLEQMEVNGFKSFFSRSQLVFPGNITAVVGPNGCGKSNISDAVCWVLGEQSAKSLRGKKMEDVIFNGSDKRKPLGMAQVTLKLISTNGVAHRADAGPEQIEITRRLYRSGDSEYRLNGDRCRLKDIRDLLFGERLGNADTAVIEQGRIEQIISNRSQERRTLIENAAGVSQYKVKKRIAENRLDGARSNLVTINTLVNELGKQHRSLKRQASAARRKVKLEEECREHKQQALTIEHARASKNRDRLLRDQGEAGRELATAGGGLARQETAFEGLRTSLEEKQTRLIDAREEAHRREVDLERLETRISAMKESLSTSKIRKRELDEEIGRVTVQETESKQRLDEARSRLTGLQQGIESEQSQVDQQETRFAEALSDVGRVETEKDEAGRERMEAMDGLLQCKNRRQALEHEQTTLTAEIGRLKARLEEFEGNRRHLQEQAAAAREQLEALTAEIASAKEREQRLIEQAEEAGKASSHLAEELQRTRGRCVLLQERLESLGEMISGRVGFSEAAQQLLTAAPENLGRVIRGALADFIKVDQDHERMVERFLGNRLEWILVEDNTSVSAVKSWLLERGLHGPCTVLPLAGPRMPSRDDRPPVDLSWLSEKIEYPDFCRDAFAPLFDRVAIAGSISEARELSGTYPGIPFITPEGDFIDPQGSITCWGRKPDTDSEAPERSRGPLALRRQAEDLQHELEASRQRELELQVDSAKAMDENTRIEAMLSTIREELKTNEEQLFRCRHQVEQLDASLRENRRQSESVASEGVRLVTERDTLITEAGTLATELEDRQSRFDGLTARGEDLRQQEESLRKHQDEIRGLLERSRTALAAGREKIQALDETCAGLTGALEDLRSRQKRLAENLEDERERQGSLDEHIGQAGKTVADLLEQLDAARKTVAEGEKERDELNLEASRLENEVKQSRLSVDESRERKEKIDLELNSVQSELSFIKNKHMESFGSPLEAIPPWKLSEIESEDGDPLEISREKAATLQTKIDRIGLVNMRAIEESQEVEERFNYYNEQKTDIEESITALQETIDRINVTSRKRFSDALEKINTIFGETFQQFFNGGTAEIALPEGADPLEADIEIMARPPGKKNQNVLQLSGGEKALSAIAFIFAVFRYRPTPFCFLDEVDAALDDANVERFLDLLKRMSEGTQFIVITHNKVTMESADLLYGVTMEEPGISKLVSVNLSNLTLKDEGPPKAGGGARVIKSRTGPSQEGEVLLDPPN